MKKKTDETLNMVAVGFCGAIAGCFITLIFVFFASVANFAGSFWSSEPVSFSTEELIQEIQQDNGNIPDSAHSIHYHRISGKDSMRWLSYQASDSDIESAIQNARKHATNGKHRWPPGPAIQQTEEERKKNGIIYYEWWPSSSRGLEVMAGERFTLGFNPVQETVYYYEFTM